MSDPTRLDVPSRSARNPRLGGPMGQRRAFLINRRYQLRASLMTATVVLVLLVFVNLVLYTASARHSSQILIDSPELEHILRGQDRVELGLVLVASIVFLAGVFVVSLLETHKTAGAAYHIERRLDELRNGRYGSSLTLRRGDNLVELERAFNALAETLRDREREEVETLERLAAHISSDPGAVAGRLRTLAAGKRQRLP